MKRKKVVVVTTDKSYAEFLMNNMKKYMEAYADFECYSIKEVLQTEKVQADFFMFSAFNYFQQVRERIPDTAEVIVLSVALNKDQVEILKEIPSGTRALLVNFDYRACMHTISRIYDAGLRDLELIPYWGGEYDSEIEVAITPNEAHLVPAGIKKVFDVGESLVDMNTLYDLADRLGVYEEFAAKEAKEARKEYYYVNSSLNKLLGEKEAAIDKLNTLVKLMNEGIIITDERGRIYLTNEEANYLLKERSQLLCGFNIAEIFPELDVRSTKEKLIKTPSANLIVSCVEIRSDDEVIGHIVTITDFEETEAKQHGIRSKLSGVNHSARYHFEDILGSSEALVKAVEGARQIASSDGAVMIIGESGTGKEMFAQSIHNASGRRKYNFIAVNCAAIPENLLESEMFGYEEGSFTGAKKGGKMGYFELAHRGTIFLDEIGEMPLHLQSKLLRVLEEKKVMRIGAQKPIDIDVRIISATNKNLFEMVESGTFREDLYYRLNVLPIQIPPLRERRGDILPIFYELIRKMNMKVQLSEEAEVAMKNYFWPGNVRELRNAAEFLLSKRKKYIETEDLPPFRDKKKNETVKEPVIGNSAVIGRFLLQEGRDHDLHYQVLEILYQLKKEGVRSGRRLIQERMQERGAVYTEGEVRKALMKLANYGFILSAKGRGGSTILPEGIQLFNFLKEFQKRDFLI